MCFDYDHVSSHGIPQKLADIQKGIDKILSYEHTIPQHATDDVNYALREISKLYFPLETHQNTVKLLVDSIKKLLRALKGV